MAAPIFPRYENLDAGGKRTYRTSDRITRIEVPDLAPLIDIAKAGGELQGLYEPDEVTGATARITVWMRTAQRVRVVKFRTFLRTLVHEVCHHLDYEFFKFPETFHTEGFYARESALMRELLGEPVPS